MAGRVSSEGLHIAGKERGRLMAGASKFERFLGFPAATSDVGEELKEEDILWGNSSTKKVEGFIPSSYLLNKPNPDKKKKKWWFESGTATISPSSSMSSLNSPSVLTGGGLSIVLANDRTPAITRTSALINVNENANYGSVKSNAAAKSAPVDVPDWKKIMGNLTYSDEQSKSIEDDDFKQSKSIEDDDFNEGYEDEEKLPPHELVAVQECRRSSERTMMCSTSVLEGVGRTLKGRDLSRVRNAVWMHTGFLG